MRLPVNRQGRHHGLLLVATVASVASLLAAPLLARQTAPLLAAPSGPAADYPMVLGAPYVVDGVTYAPADTMNIDHVGYAAVEQDAGAGVTISHRTLPLPSYVEVTSLRTGRTILARVERRGPLSGPNLFGLSAGAAAQLGAAPGDLDSRTPVRVRRVNPPESERALLRTGQSAPVRMDTPMSLVGVLLRKLDPALVPPAPAQAAVPAPVPSPATTAQKGPMIAATPPVKAAPAATKAGPRPPVVAAAPKAAPPKAEPPKAERKAATEPRPAQSAGKSFVQVGAFSTRERAEVAARQVGGTISPAGKLFRVRIAGLATSAEASTALAKAKGAGYSDARIQRAD